MNDIFEYIFEEHLFGWWTDESAWPKKRTKEMFSQWFEVEFHSVVLDPYDDPIEKEEW